MEHFVARCERYPQYMFSVPKLRPHFLKRGMEHTSTVVRFKNRVLDTRAQDFTPQEAKEILAVLERMKEQPPIFGVDIKLKGV